MFIKFTLDEKLKYRIEKEKNQGNTPYIVLSVIQDMQIQLPTLAEQEKIAGILSAIDEEIATLKKKFECLKLQKKALMQQLLSGKMRVKF